MENSVGVFKKYLYLLLIFCISPLPEELKTYAREDTHYLLYIYDKLKIELSKKANGNDNLVRAVYQKSTEICKKVCNLRFFMCYLKLCINDFSVFINRF